MSNYFIPIQNDETEQNDRIKGIISSLKNFHASLSNWLNIQMEFVTMGYPNELIADLFLFLPCILDWIRYLELEYHIKTVFHQLPEHPFECDMPWFYDGGIHPLQTAMDQNKALIDGYLREYYIDY